MLNVLLVSFYQSIDFLLKQNGNMQQQQTLDKENTISTKDKRNILGLEIIHVLTSVKTKVTNWLTLNKETVITVELQVGQMMVLILQML
ncbi:hypothetical protein D3C80_1623960 [compost metagenome]